MDFLERMTTYQKEQQKNVVEGFSEFLNMASLYGTNILKKEIHNENDTVKLMTLHASKGLEFSHVFITGVNYGLIPLQTKSFEEEEEEQRLFLSASQGRRNIWNFPITQVRDSTGQHPDRADICA